MLQSRRIYLPPLSLIGPAALNDLGEELRSLPCKKVLFVTDKILVKLGVAQKVIDIFNSRNIEVLVFDDVQPNPTVENVNNGLNISQDNSCDLIVTLGGGSPQDYGKAIGIPDRFAYSTAKGAIMVKTLSVARDYMSENILCNSISPARVHTPFVYGFIAKNYPSQEAEMFEKLSKSQPIGRMGKPDEVAALALFLCSDESGFITGCDYPIDGGFIKLNN